MGKEIFHEQALFKLKMLSLKFGYGLNCGQWIDQSTTVLLIPQEILLFS